MEEEKQIIETTPEVVEEVVEAPVEEVAETTEVQPEVTSTEEVVEMPPANE